jgi:hypothetical protein
MTEVAKPDIAKLSQLTQASPYGVDLEEGNFLD